MELSSSVFLSTNLLKTNFFFFTKGKDKSMSEGRKIVYMWVRVGGPG